MKCQKLLVQKNSYDVGVFFKCTESFVPFGAQIGWGKIILLWKSSRIRCFCRRCLTLLWEKYAGEGLQEVDLHGNRGGDKGGLGSWDGGSREIQHDCSGHSTFGLSTFPIMLNAPWVRWSTHSCLLFNFKYTQMYESVSECIPNGLLSKHLIFEDFAYQAASACWSRLLAVCIPEKSIPGKLTASAFVYHSLKTIIIILAKGVASICIIVLHV